MDEKKQNEPLDIARDFFNDNAVRMFNDLMVRGDILTLVYYPKTKEYQMYNLPDVFASVPMHGTDYPHSLFPFVRMSEKHQREFSDAVRSIDEGAPDAGCVVKVLTGGHGMWAQMRWINYYDEEGKPDHVLAYGMNVTERKEQENKFAEQVIRNQNIQGKIISASCFNVTKDTTVRINGITYENALSDDHVCPKDIEESIYRDDPSVEHQSEETKKALFSAAENITDPQKRKEFVNMCSNRGLLESFRKGITKGEIEYRTVISGRIADVRTKLVLMRNPETWDIYAFFYTTDISEKKLTDKVIDMVLHQTSDYVSVVDLNEGKAKFLFISDEVKNVSPQLAVGMDFDYYNSVKGAAEGVMPFEKADELIGQVSLDTIEETLDRYGVLTAAFEINYKDHKLHKQARFIWLDKDSRLVLCVQQDVTRAWIQEQERIRRIEEMRAQAEKIKTDDAILRAVVDTNEFVAIYDGNTDVISLRSGSWFSHGVETPENMRNLPLTKLTEYIAEKCVPTIEEGERFRSEFRRDVVLRKLSESNTYVETFDFLHPINKKNILRKQFRISVLDRKKNLFLCVRTDTTESYRLSRRVETDDLIMRRSLMDNLEFIALYYIADDVLQLRVGDWESDIPTPPEKSELPYELFVSYEAKGIRNEADRKSFCDKISLESVKTVLEAKDSLEVFFDNAAPDGRTNKKRMVLSWLDPVKKERILITRADITKSVENEQRLNQHLQDALKSAEQSNRAKTEFLSSMSHDIRTPMNAIIGFTTLILNNTSDPERVADKAKKILSSSNHLLGLINDVLDMSKIDSGKVNVSLREFRLADTIAMVDSIIRPQTDAKHQEYDIYVKNVKHEKYINDDNRIQQILINILSNAMKYTHEGGRIVMRVTGLPESSGLYDDILFEIEDNGMGMSEDFLKIIFEPFSREKSAVEGMQGTGLGMAITQNLVHMMGGTIEVESKLGEGSKFKVSIPMKITGEKENRSFWKDNALTHMLVVDDEQEICENIADAMAGTGVRIEFAYDGWSAVEKVRKVHGTKGGYDIVLLDWKMPDMNGFDTAKKIREELPPDVLIIILTAYDFTEIEDRAKEVGVNGFIQKPFFVSEFRHTVEKLENKKHTETEDSLDASSDKSVSDEENVLNGLKILAAEDNELNGEILCEVMKLHGAEVVLKTDGKQALEEFKASLPGTYDLILLDIQMPVMNGYDAARGIRALSSEDSGCSPEKRAEAQNAAVIAMTANAFSEDVQRALVAGMDAHVPKPLNIETLKKTVYNTLKKKRKGNKSE